MRLPGDSGPGILASGLGCLLLTLSCGACASAGRGPAGQSGSLKVATFTPAPGQPIPASLTEASPLGLSVTVRDGYACFTMAGTPVAWPAGFSAVTTGGGKPAVRTASGSLLRNGAAYRLDVMGTASTGDLCTAKGQYVTAVLKIRSAS